MAQAFIAAVKDTERYRRLYRKQIRLLEQAANCWNRHREERSDAAIQELQGALVTLDCFAALAMTIVVRPKCNLD